MTEPYYELWDLASGNMIAHSDMGDDLPALVRELFELGWKAEQLSLGQCTAQDRAHAIWEGDDLRAWAVDQSAKPTRVVELG